MTSRREAYGWLAILLTFALGTTATCAVFLLMKHAAAMSAAAMQR